MERTEGAMKGAGGTKNPGIFGGLRSYPQLSKHVAVWSIHWDESHPAIIMVQWRMSGR